MSSLGTLFNPGSIILIGAAHTEMKLGGVVLKNLLRFGGRVLPVNPKYDEMMGLKTYRSVRDVPGLHDVALIMRPAAEVPEILRELHSKTRFVVVMSSGFAEIGEKELQDEVKGIGRETGLRILGPNCMGVFNPYRRLDTFFLPHDRLKRPKKGNVAVVSQSGALLSCLFDAIRASNAGLSKAIGYGNAIDIDESEIYEYFAEDDKTAIVISYIESVGDGRRFIESAKNLSERKPLIILKSGKGESGQTAAYSHTGRLAGKYEVFRSILKQFGIREAVDFEELIDAAKALSYQRPSKFLLPPFEKGGQRGVGNRVLIITNGGGPGILAVDECMRHGLDVIRVPEEKLKRLGELFPNFYGVNNPIDLTAQVKDEDFVTALTELKDHYDGFLLIVLPNIYGITEGLAERLKKVKEEIKKPMVFNVPANGVASRIIRLLEKEGMPVYPSPERAVRALKALLG